MDKKIDWATFVHRSKLDLQDWSTGPVSSMVKKRLDEGRLTDASHVAADHFQALTNFRYTRGDTPSVISGTMGRFFGQYGNWPLAYISYINHIATVGDKKLSANRIQAFGTLIALSAGVTAATAEVFDADASKWAAWHSFGFKGGPFLTMAEDAKYVATSWNSGRYEKDPEAKMRWSRLQSQLQGQFIPGRAGIQHIAQTVDPLMKGDLQGAGRELMGMPKGSPTATPGSWQ
jgi:hypothetical protein